MNNLAGVALFKAKLFTNGVSFSSFFRNYHDRKKKIIKEWTTKNGPTAAAAAADLARSAAAAAAATGMHAVFKVLDLESTDMKPFGCT